MYSSVMCFWLWQSWLVKPWNSHNNFQYTVFHSSQVHCVCNHPLQFSTCSTTSLFSVNLKRPLTFKRRQHTFSCSCDKSLYSEVPDFLSWQKWRSEYANPSLLGTLHFQYFNHMSKDTGEFLCFKKILSNDFEEKSKVKPDANDIPAFHRIEWYTQELSNDRDYMCLYL